MPHVYFFFPLFPKAEADSVLLKYIYMYKPLCKKTDLATIEGGGRVTVALRRLA